ncbi:tRNA (adenine(37)-N6)-methyltransferase [Patella vulgata]|uniref:tRNA (adenine(37)-N6)-methyltransferase n=1 Tax=Patella vulgata TaxID=6465 RepID=UPI0024A7E0EC|nr:tRNA (adenine(37)-N6)-methyltransferase [Patella vulgata]
MEMCAIGVMKSVFLYKNGTPRQSSVCQHARGSITIDKSIFNNPDHSLHGLEEYSHVWIMFIFHQNNNNHFKAKVRPPRLGGKRLGVFSTRSPYRPNPIGLTLAKLDRVEGSTVYVSGIDILNETPIIDIKPYIPAYDQPVTRPDNHSTNTQSQNIDTEETGYPDVSEFPQNSVKNCIFNSLSVDDRDTDKSKELQKFVKNSKVNACESKSQPLQVTGAVDASRGTTLQSQNCPSLCPERIIYPETPNTCENKASLPVTECANDASREITSTIRNVATPWHQTVSDIKTNYDVSCGGSVAQNVLISNEKSLCICENEQQIDFDVLKEAIPRESTVKTASWLEKAKDTQLTVRFTQNAREELLNFSSEASDDTHNLKFILNPKELEEAVVEILRGDPRSIYRKKSCGDSLYYFTVDIVHVTCWFDENMVEVLRLKPISDVKFLNPNN